MNEDIKNMVRNTPNDADLGQKVRALYNILFGNNQHRDLNSPHQEGTNNNKGKHLLNG